MTQEPFSAMDTAFSLSNPLPPSCLPKYTEQENESVNKISSSEMSAYLVRQESPSTTHVFRPLHRCMDGYSGATLLLLQWLSHANIKCFVRNIVHSVPERLTTLE